MMSLLKLEMKSYTLLCPIWVSKLGVHSGRTGVGNQNYENFKIQFLHFNPSIWVFMSPIFQYFEKLWHFRPILNDFKIPILGWIYQISYIFGNFIVWGFLKNGKMAMKLHWAPSLVYNSEITTTWTQFFILAIPSETF